MPRSGISIELKPTLRGVAGRFARADARLLAEKRDGMRMLGRRWVAIARSEAPLGKTGHFRRSIGFRTWESAKTVGFNTYAAQPLARYIALGTRPHAIVARRARALHFFWKNGPKGPGWYSFYSVWHPGTRPNPYHERATAAWMPEADIELRRMARSYIAALGV